MFIFQNSLNFLTNNIELSQSLQPGFWKETFERNFRKKKSIPGMELTCKAYIYFQKVFMYPEEIV